MIERPINHSKPFDAHRFNRSKSLGMMILGWLAYGIVCLFALSFGVFASIVGSNPLFSEAMRSLLPGNQNPFENRDDFFLLVLGCDENRAPGGKKIIHDKARADSIQLVRFNFKDKAIGMLQIPRDLEVRSREHGIVKINALTVYETPRSLANAVQELTSTRIDRVVALNYDAIRKMVDAVGGVSIFVEKRMRYHDRRGDLHIDFSPGLTHLNGQKAVEYLRFRRDSDFNRGARQQEFMVAFRRQIFKEGLDLAMLMKLAKAASELVEGELSDQEFFYLGKFAETVQTTRIKHGRLPTIELPGSYDLRLDPTNLHDALIESGIKDAPLQDKAQQKGHSETQ